MKLKVLKMRRSEVLTASQLARCPLKDIQQQKPLVCVSPTVQTANLPFDNMLLVQSSKPPLLLLLLVLLWPPSSNSCSFTPILNFGGLGAGGCPVSCLAVCVSVFFICLSKSLYHAGCFYCWSLTVWTLLQWTIHIWTITMWTVADGLQ